jgi:hypothetical protein
LAFKQLISVLILAAVAMAQSRPADSLAKLQSEVEQLKARLDAMKGLEERVALLEQELLEVRLQSKVKPAGPTAPAAPVSAKNGTPGLTPPTAGATETVKAVVEPVEPAEAVVQTVKRPVIEEEAPFDAVKLRAAEAEAEAAAKAAEEAAAAAPPAAAAVQTAEPAPVATLPAAEPVPATVPVVALPPDPEPDPIKGLPGRSTAGSPAKLDLSRVGKETLVIVVHQQNPLDDISTSQLRDVLLKRMRSWPNRSAVTLVLSDPDSELFGRVANTVLHLSALEYQASTARRTDRRVSSASPQDLVTLVMNDPTAVTVVPVELVAGRTGVKLLSVAGKNPGEQGYGF